MINRRVTVIGIALFVLIFITVPIAFADSTYVVKPGDNLFRIALNHGLTTQQLAAANNIADVRYVHAGQVLTIPDGREESNQAAEQPAPAASAPVEPSSSYLVQRGDTLGRIALQHGVSLQSLAQANGISPTSWVYYGQTLAIPGSSENTESAAPAPAPAVPPPTAPPPIASSGGERWVDVNLTTQHLTAFEGNTPVFNSPISSGTWQYPTVVGQFRVYIRHESQTMDGRYLGYDYVLPGVPYVMYFYKGFALHGTYWHNNFGTPMSHGCVNLPTPAAQWIYNWSDYGLLVNVHY
jgi:LysM repeat protein